MTPSTPDLNKLLAEATAEPHDLLAETNGRARFLRDRGEIKTPDLLDALAAEVLALRAKDEAAQKLAEALAERDDLRAALEGLIAVLDRNDKKGPIPDVEMMFCWLAAQDVRAAFRKTAPKGEAT